MPNPNIDSGIISGTKYRSRNYYENNNIVNIPISDELIKNISKNIDSQLIKKTKQELLNLTDDYKRKNKLTDKYIGTQKVRNDEKELIIQV